MMEHTGHIQKSRKRAFTLAEFLVVAAITMILAGVSFAAVLRYQRQLKRLEMDQTAKEIFLAAQNRLSLEQSRGTFERLLSLDADSREKLGIRVEAMHGEADESDDDSGTGALYGVLYQPGTEDNETEEIRKRLLPFGSIDETVRTDGSYVILYEPGTGAVRSVWYSDSYVFVEGDLGSQQLSEASADVQKRERFIGNNQDLAEYGRAIGYYASSGAGISGDGEKVLVLKEIKLELINDSALYARVTDPNMADGKDYDLKLFFEGVSSGAKGSVDLKASGSHHNARAAKSIEQSAYLWILDDITNSETRFTGLNNDRDVRFEGTERLIPGEDIRVYVQAFAPGQSRPIVSTKTFQENSIFQAKKSDKVTISNIRHLENLDYRISGFHPMGSHETLGLSQVGEAFAAVQQNDLSWSAFRADIADIHQPFGSLEKQENLVSVCYMAEVDGREQAVWTASGCYAPIEPQFPLIYDGNTFAIDEILVRTSGDQAGGLFGRVSKNLSVRKVVVRQPDVQSEASAGGLIGCGSEDATKIQIEQVLIQYPQIQANGVMGEGNLGQADAGGLIGDFAGAELVIHGSIVENSFLTQVSGGNENDKVDIPKETETMLCIYSESTNAGGLLGGMTGGTLSVYSSAAAVYVNAGMYAGGLLGNVGTDGAVQIEGCYVGGHTTDGKFLSAPLPGEVTFAQTAGRYNIVSRTALAGGLAGVIPAGSSISHSYVSASVYSSGTAKAAAADWGKEPQANAEQKKAAFVGIYGAQRAGRAAAAAGKDAAQFPFCYSSVFVNGARAVVYPDTLKEFFETGTRTASQAFPYDEVLEAAYPMPTVLLLAKKDPSVLPETVNGLSRYVRVHIGDWMNPRGAGDDDPAKGAQLNNGNRLWVDYVTDLPDGDEQKYVTFSVTGKNSGNTVYYLVDLKLKRFQLTCTEEELNSIETPWRPLDDMKRLELEMEDGQMKLRFYLDNLGVPQGRYQGIYTNGWGWNQAELDAGEDIEIRWCEEPKAPKESDPMVEVNSTFERVEKNDDGENTYTAYISNGRHLLNLGLCGEKNSGLIITRAVQTDNILWQPDDSVTAKTEPYCKELETAYGKNEIYPGVGQEPETSHNGFLPIDNEDLFSYDGGGYTITKLNMSQLLNNSLGSSLFVKNSHLEVFNLTIKDPIAESNSNSAILLQRAGDENGYGSEDSYLKLHDIQICGDDMRVISTQWTAYAGGIAAVANVSRLEMERVRFYGKNAIVEKTRGGCSLGGLIGYLNIREGMKIDQCVFSGYLAGVKGSEGYGGLIGQLIVPETMQNAAQITNCYVAGRNLPYPYRNQEDGTEQLQNGVSIAGISWVGGLIGRAQGALKIANTFCAAGVYDSDPYWTGGSGGLIGSYEGQSNLILDSCYFAGNINQPRAAAGTLSWNGNTGILIGNLNLASVQFMDCAYLSLDHYQGKKIIGSLNEATAAGVTACVPGNASMNQILRPAADDEGKTYPYDESLSGLMYPYRIWTTEDGKAVYRGDWMQAEP